MDTITVSISHRAAVAMIRLAGGTHDPRGGWTLAGTHYWQTDEALKVALEEIAGSDLAR